MSVLLAKRGLGKAHLVLVYLFLLTAISESRNDENAAKVKHKKESACSAMMGRECLCRRPRSREQNLVCFKENCLRKFPTDNIPDSQAKEVESLLITRQQNLTRIGSDELQRLKNVKNIRIFRCQVSEVAENAFNGLNKVERLDLHRNNLAEVPAAIRHLRELEYLNLGGNRIVHLRNDSFYANSHLKRLILTRNPLTTLHSILPPSLIKLSVSNTKLKSLGNLQNLIKLRILYADNNFVSRFPQLPSSLRKLSLCSNRIRRPISLKDLPDLTVVNLNHNSDLGSIGPETFHSTTSRSPSRLVSFKARNSGIRSVTVDAFICLPRLRHVDVAFNSIKTYHAAWFVGNRRLRSAYLTGNPWQCSCDIESSLKQVAHTFSQRRRQAELKRARKNFRFDHDFENVTCPEAYISCEEFTLNKSVCSYRHKRLTEKVPFNISSREAPKKPELTMAFTSLNRKTDPLTDADTSSSQSAMMPTSSTTMATTSDSDSRWCLDDDRKCKFPFLYQGVEQNECISTLSYYGISLWCSATYNYDIESDWGYCKKC